MFENILEDNSGLQIYVRTVITGKYSGIRFLPSMNGYSRVAVFGISGVQGIKRGQKINNVMKIGDFVRKVISEKRLRFKKEKDAYSLDLYRAYEQSEAINFGFLFTIKEANYLQNALFSVRPSKFIEYQTSAKPVAQVKSYTGLEAIEFEFEKADVDYGKELDPMYLYRMKQNIVRAVAGK